MISGIDDAEAAAAVAEHRVELVELVTRCAIFSTGMPIFLARSACCAGSVGEELVQRRIEQADRDREAHRAEDADEVVALVYGRSLASAAFAARAGCRREDHLAHGVDAVALEEHVLGAAEADAGAPNATALRVCPGVSALVRT